MYMSDIWFFDVWFFYGQRLFFFWNIMRIWMDAWWIVNGQWWKFNYFTLSEAKCKLDQHTISFQLSIQSASEKNQSPIYCPLTIHNWPFASTAGGLRNCNAAAFASFWKFAAPFSKYRLRRYRTKRGGLCNYWWKCGQRNKDPNR